MRILFTNDDGYDSQGLHAVADLFKDEHDIAVVAPDVQKSGFSHSLTLKPVSVAYREVSGYDYKVFAVGGTPVDCVKTARNVFFPKPDLVVSGINNGGNLGSDIMYSGTVSAAVDAAHSGIRAVALSYVDRHATASDFARCAEIFKRNFDKIISLEIPPKTMLNINFPIGEPKGIQTVRMNTQETFVDVYSEDDGKLIPSGHRDYSTLDKDTDEGYCLDGYITITPLTTDKTDYSLLERIKRERFVL